MTPNEARGLRLHFDEPVVAYMTRDLEIAHVDTHVPHQRASDVMTHAPIDVHQPLSAALDLLDRRHVTGLIVTEQDQPIGMFAQADALASRELDKSTSIEDSYDPAVICLPDTMKLHRAAAHVADLRVRRVVACRAREPVGIVSASDFARFVALS